MGVVMRGQTCVEQSPTGDGVQQNRLNINIKEKNSLLYVCHD